MSTHKAFSGPMELAEVHVREVIAASYIERQEELFARTGERFHSGESPCETFDRIQQSVRMLYAEPAGKLALSKALWQRGSIDSKTGETTWKFRHPDRGERLAKRLESVLIPVGEPVLPRIEKVAKDELVYNPRLKNPNIERVVCALQRIWTNYGALEEEHRTAEPGMSFIEYILQTRRARFPELWYEDWHTEVRHTAKSYVPGAEAASTTTDEQPEAEPEQIVAEPTPQPDLDLITQAIAGLPEQAAEVLRCFLTARQNRLSHSEFSESLGTDTREATMRLAAAYQEATEWLDPAEYNALTAIRYL